MFQPPPIAFTSKHAGLHAARLNAHLGYFVRERGILRRNHLEIIHNAALIAIDRERQRMLGGSDRGLLDYFFIIEDSQSCEIVFHFLKCAQHRLPVGINRFAVRGLRLLRYGVAFPASKMYSLAVGAS